MYRQAAAWGLTLAPQPLCAAARGLLWLAPAPESGFRVIVQVPPSLLCGIALASTGKEGAWGAFMLKSYIPCSSRFFRAHAFEVLTPCLSEWISA